jgi:hypothetical protein
VSRYTYPTPPALDSNQVHQVDCTRPIYLLGQRQRYYLWTCKDVFDGAICLDLSRSRRKEAVLAFLGKCWTRTRLGRPRIVQFAMRAKSSAGAQRPAISPASCVYVCASRSSPG